MTPALIYNELHRVWEIHYVSTSGLTHWAKSQFKTLSEAHRKLQIINSLDNDRNFEDSNNPGVASRKVHRDNQTREPRKAARDNFSAVSGEGDLF